METRIAGSKGEMLRNQVYNADESTLAALGARLIEGRNFTRDEVDAEWGEAERRWRTRARNVVGRVQVILT